MKSCRRILALALSILLVCSLTTAWATQTENPLVARFSVSDMAVGYVYVLSTGEEALSVFGEPVSSETLMQEATGEELETWYYDGLDLIFDGEGMLIGANVSSPAYIGPRGMRVGQTADEIVSLFYIDTAIADDTVLYSARYVEALGAQMPPFGELFSLDNGGFTLHYAAPSAPFSDEVLNDPMDFIYEELASLTVMFDASQTATEFHWFLGPWAE